MIYLKKTNFLICWTLEHDHMISYFMEINWHTIWTKSNSGWWNFS